MTEASSPYERFGSSARGLRIFDRWQRGGGSLLRRRLPLFAISRQCPEDRHTKEDDSQADERDRWLFPYRIYHDGQARDAEERRRNRIAPRGKRARLTSVTTADHEERCHCDAGEQD